MWPEANEALLPSGYTRWRRTPEGRGERRLQPRTSPRADTAQQLPTDVIDRVRRAKLFASACNWYPFHNARSAESADSRPCRPNSRFSFSVATSMFRLQLTDFEKQQSDHAQQNHGRYRHAFAPVGEVLKRFPAALF